MRGGVAPILIYTHSSRDYAQAQPPNKGKTLPLRVLLGVLGPQHAKYNVKT